MKNEILSLTAGFLAMLLIGGSYFFTKKKYYLFFQASGIVFLMASYLFDEAFFAMVGLGVALVRTLVYYAYEKRDKFTPLWVGLLFVALTVLAYVIVNLWILKTAKPIDIICVASLVAFALVVRIRDLETVRYLVLLPIVLSIVYNAFSGAAVFVTVSYSFELVMSILAICKYQIFNKKAKENTDEQS
ncbi:MAG: YgjV family protein [Clostridia bacterium]|nr:YgjV family protein [Clostridia bacterium]